MSGQAFYVKLSEWNKRATAREFSKAEWGNLAEEAWQSGLEQATKILKSQCNPLFETYESSEWQTLKPYQQAAWIAAVKFIARKLK